MTMTGEQFYEKNIVLGLLLVSVLELGLGLLIVLVLGLGSHLTQSPG